MQCALVKGLPRQINPTEQKIISPRCKIEYSVRINVKATSIFSNCNEHTASAYSYFIAVNQAKRLPCSPNQKKKLNEMKLLDTYPIENQFILKNDKLLQTIIHSLRKHFPLASPTRPVSMVSGTNR